MIQDKTGFKEFDLIAILESKRELKDARRIYEHLDNLDQMRNEKQVSEAEAKVQELEKTLDKEYMNGALFRPETITETIHLMLDSPEVDPESKDFDINFLTNLVAAMNLPYYQVSEYQRQKTEGIIARLEDNQESLEVYAKKEFCEHIGAIKTTIKKSETLVEHMKRNDGVVGWSLEVNENKIEVDAYQIRIELTKEKSIAIRYWHDEDAVRIIDIQADNEQRLLGYDIYLIDCLKRKARQTGKKEIRYQVENNSFEQYILKEIGFSGETMSIDPICSTKCRIKYNDKEEYIRHMSFRKFSRTNE